MEHARLLDFRVAPPPGQQRDSVFCLWVGRHGSLRAENGLNGKGGFKEGASLRLAGPLMPMCTENFVGIDLMKESLNVGQDGRADISLRDT
jgi:hypothetical protein